jgi:hypothetical protein
MEMVIDWKAAIDRKGTAAYANHGQDAMETKKTKFIISYLKRNYCTDACDQKFHEAWFQEFGGARKMTAWGSQPVYSAQRYLKKLYKQGVLERGIVPLGANWQPGFPKWVYGYTLKNDDK